MAVFLARMVMPRSRSSSFESITRSATASLARNVPLCLSIASTSVVLPWSTCAMMAMLRILRLKVWVVLYCGSGFGAKATVTTLLCVDGSQEQFAYGTTRVEAGTRDGENI